MLKSDDDWDKLEDDYVRTNAILIIRALYTGTDCSSSKEIINYDDFEIDKYEWVDPATLGEEDLKSYNRMRNATDWKGNYIFFGENEYKKKLSDKKLQVLFKVQEKISNGEFKGLGGILIVSNDGRYEAIGKPFYFFARNKKTRSWSCEYTFENMDKTFEIRDIDTSKPHKALYDVPFGHVVGFDNMDICDITGDTLHPLYSSDIQPLNDKGMKYSNKYRVRIH